MEAIGRFLLQDTTHLLTVAGPPGVGKTRLAVEVAGHLAGGFRDGVYFVRLAHLDSATQVVPALEEALQVGNAEGRPPLEGVKEYLMGKQVLLVLDNFEHVLEAAQYLPEIVGIAPEVKILVTSREVLNISLEHEFVVPPLSVPNIYEPEQLRQLEGYEAVQLFAHRAMLARPGFELNDENIEVVATICRMLEGLPLSIELAASRIKLIAPGAMAERLDSRLGLLIGGSRDLPRRHQTLRNALEWSYNLLTEDEARLFRRLAIFTGKYSLQAIEQVCDVAQALDPGATEIVDRVTALVEKSLLMSEEGAGGEPCYSMLETIHEYAQEKLDEIGERSAVTSQFVRYYLGLAQRAEAELRGPNQDVWLERLQRDHSNLCAAWQGAAATGQVELLPNVAPALGQFWARCGHWALGREQLGGLLADPDVLWQPLDRARTLYPLAYIAYLQGEYPYARSIARESFNLFRQVGDSAGIADSLNLMGFVASMEGDKTRARRLHAQSLASARAAEYWLGVPLARYGIALIDMHAGHTAVAHARMEESYIACRRIGDLLGIAYSLYCMGLADWLEASYSEAREHCEEGLLVYSQIHDKKGKALSLQVLGHIPGQEVDRGDVNTRHRYLRESLSLLCELGLRRYVPGTLAGLALLAVEEADLVRAARLLGAAHSLAETARSDAVPGQAVMLRAAVRKLPREADAVGTRRAWLEGEAMPLQEIVGLACGR
jgi:predicted ATPase